MAAVRTSLTAAGLPDDLAALRARIENAVPVGFGSHSCPVPAARVHGDGGWDAFWAGFGDLHDGVQNLRERALHQMWTLGGGNHFIEICTDGEVAGEGSVWVMLHSGSRNIGKKLAERHIAVAQGLSHNADLPDRDLAVFLSGTPQMDAYRRVLFWAQEYARRSRATMLALLCALVRDALPGADVRYDDPLSCHHNNVAEETYDGVDVLVTRKGAIRAGSGELGLIPGSMGVGSYVVRGLGSAAAFNSASHGAGRTMSRNKARKTFTAADLAAQTAGVECRKDVGVVDEIPAAYKDLDAVMARQSDLVEVVARLRPLVREGLSQPMCG